MKITRLELENWMGIPQLVLDLGTGINLLYGRNEIGKSSIIHSIRQGLLGDAKSNKSEYKLFKPWGANVKAKVNLSFTCKDNKAYRIYKSFPAGGAELYQGDILLSSDPKKTQEKIYQILEISEKTTNLFHLLFIDQGDTLNIFNKKGKDNPLDENTKSYIKEIIKETAFKEIQEFQDHINKEMDNYLIPKRDRPKKNSEYSKLLEFEKTLAGKIIEFQQKESDIKEKLGTIDKTGKEVEELTQAIEGKDKYLEALKKKRNRLAELKEKEKEFEYVQKSYDNYIKIVQEQEEIRQRQSVLAATRLQRLEDLKTELQQLETGKKQSQKRLEQMRQKKKVWEELETFKREFAQLKKDYDSVSQLEKQTGETAAQLPELLALHRHRLEEEMQNLTKTIRDRSQLESEKGEIEARLKELPVIKPEDIDKLRKLEKENGKIETRIDSAREKLKLSFRLTPLAGKEIPYAMSKDGEEPVRGSAVQPLAVKDFHELDFTYEEHLNLQVKGDLTETDIGELQEKLAWNRRRMEEGLAIFGVKEIETLQHKQQKRNELETRLKSVQGQLKSMGESVKLEEQVKVIRRQLEKVEQDGQRYIKVKAEGKPESPSAGEARKLKIQGTGPEIRDRLTEAKTRLDSYRQEIDRVLTARQCTFDQLESLYKKQEAELHRREKDYKEMEPKAVTVIDQERLDKEVAGGIEIEKKTSSKQEELKVLEGVEAVAFQPESTQQVKVLKGLTTQGIRDDIIQSANRAKGLQKEKKELLGKAEDQEFKMNYFRRRDEIAALKKDLAGVPPEGINDLDKVDLEIENISKEIKVALQEKGEKEKQRERLKGETADFSHLIEEKTEKELAYRQVLEKIRGEVVELTSLRLLTRLIEEERERAQQEVFRPLQERVHRSFTSLVGERYKVGIDNDMNLEIDGKTVSGEFQAGVGEALSFGTREQLSFLFRLAIAGQLSRKEPTVMVLDDSFVNTDLNRFPLLLDMLCERAAELQFLVFTCRPEDYLSNLSCSRDKNLLSIDLENLLKVS